MSEPTRQEIINAHDALEALCKCLTGTRAAKETILRALPPCPRPTMAEVEWDDDKHYLAEAEHEYQGAVTMLAKNTYGWVLCFRRGGHEVFTADPRLLTLISRRYTLTEVQE